MVEQNSIDWWAVFATGPSFKRVDAEQLRWCKTVAVNNAVFYCPWVDIQYACDAKWWRFYGKKIPWFGGQKYSYQHHPGCERFYRPGHFPTAGGNGGNQAMQLAYVNRDTSRPMGIVITGFDHQHTEGQKHCHGDHPRPLGNAGSVMNWPEAMERTAKVLKRKGVTVINCSRETALTCFPRMSVEEFCEQYRHP